MFLETASTLARAALGGALSVLAPARCRMCRAALFSHANPFLCASCAAQVQWIGRGACRGCGFPAGPHASHGRECRRCRGRKLRLTGAAAAARYGAGARELVLCFKFRGETELARPLAGLMAERLRTADLPAADIILPVALHPARRRERGFDQAALLAKEIARLTGIPAPGGVLRRTRFTRPQAALRREDRLGNMTDAFEASPAAAGKSVLLVDDVMTTGATMAACAAACRQAGAKHVFALVFAR